MFGEVLSQRSGGVGRGSGTDHVLKGCPVGGADSGSLAWGIALDGFKPDRWDFAGAAICLIGVAVIMFAPRG